MLLRPFGAMNGFWGGAAPPSTAFGVAVEPSKGVTLPLPGSVGIGTTGSPAVCAMAAAAQLAQSATEAAAAATHTPPDRRRIRATLPRPRRAGAGCPRGCHPSHGTPRAETIRRRMDQQRPIELILARNFLTSLSTPAF